MRIAAHVHSDWSYDGSWSLEDLSRAFARRGYGAILTAEHDKTFDAARWEEYVAACAEASARAGGALLVPGIEYSDADNRVHVPVWGAPSFLGAARETAGLLADARAAEATAVIAHPARRDAGASLPDEVLALADGIELWNRKYDGWAPNAIGDALAARHGLRPFVGLDFHTARQFFPLAMAGPVDARTSDAVYAALRAGALAPRALKLPARGFTRGPGRSTAHAAEGLRRPLARALRTARRRVRSS